MQFIYFVVVVFYFLHFFHFSQIDFVCFGVGKCYPVQAVETVYDIC